MEFGMNKSLNFPENIIWEYASINPGDFVSEYNQNWSYRYAYGDNPVIKVILDTSNVTNMSNMFYECKNLSYVSPFNTSNVIDMSYMFYYCQVLRSMPQLDTSKVTNMSNMFSNCISLKSIPQLDTSMVTNVSRFFGFSNIYALTDLGGFKDLGKKSSISGTNSTFLDNASNLTHDSLMNVINNLYDRKTNGLSTLTISFGATNLNKLTDEEKAIAINKGWVLI
jgi:surface protein